MTRMVSLVVLLAILLVVGLLFFEVMLQFLLPLFLALLLVVMFRPLHCQYLARFPNRNYLCAGLSTATILLIFLLPLSLIALKAASEVWSFYRASAAKPAAADAPREPAPEAQRDPAAPERRRQLAQSLSAALAQEPDVSEVVIRFGESQDKKFAGRLLAAAIDERKTADILVRIGQQVGLQLDTAWVESALDREMIPSLAAWVAPVGFNAVRGMAGLLFGLAVMTIAVFFFLADGPGMIRTIMQLSPLDDRHETQLIEQFDQVARAVVLATVLSAIAQGLLAGIGFYLVGLKAVFTLTALAMLLAMVPFVGAAAVWAPACLWLLFAEQRVGAAVFLAVYGAGVVSMADNLIKPLVLRGRSNIHPLLALLSVLGGVQVLGAIGIFVGPMLVAFLQALLIMLQKELREMAAEGAGGRPGVTARADEQKRFRWKKPPPGD